LRSEGFKYAEYWKEEIENRKEELGKRIGETGYSKK